MTEPDLTVVTVTHNSAAVIGSFLRSLPDGLAGTNHEVIIVDNASTDATLDVVRQTAAESRIICLEGNYGYAAGINAGVAERELGGPVLVANPDIALRPGCAVALAAALEQGVGISAPRLVAPDGTTHFSLRRDPTLLRALGEATVGGLRAGRHDLWGEMVTGHTRYNQPGDADWVTGAAMMISAECARALGEWDESFFLYSEETEFAIRARKAGFRVRYVPDATALHIGGESNVSPELWSLLVRHPIRLYRKYHTAFGTALYAGVVATNEVLRAAAGRPTNRRALRDLLHPRAAVLPPRLPGQVALHDSEPRMPMGVTN